VCKFLRLRYLANLASHRSPEMLIWQLSFRDYLSLGCPNRSCLERQTTSIWAICWPVN